MNRLFAFYYDSFMRFFERKFIYKWRKDLLQHAKGTVLEIGSGTGVNFAIYDDCREVIAVEPNSFMVNKSLHRQKQAIVPIKVIDGQAEALPFSDASFDTIVSTLVLCSVHDQYQVLGEMRRLLKPHGSILILEHVQLEHPKYAKLQTWLTPFWKKICDGCHLNRRTEKVIEQAGFLIISKKSYLDGLVISLIATKVE